MKLIKLTNDHYIIVDDLKINNGDVHFDFDKNEIDIWEGNLHSNRLKCKKITHSTQPESLGMGWMQSVLPLLLSEVKELIGEVDVEKKAEIIAKSLHDKSKHDDWSIYDQLVHEDKELIKLGYNQALEDNKEKKWTDDDLRKAIFLYAAWITGGSPSLRIAETAGQRIEQIIKSLQPKTEWDVEFIDGKLKLK